MFGNASIRCGLAAALILILAGCAGAGPPTESPNPSATADGAAGPAAPGGSPAACRQMVLASRLTADDLVTAGWPDDVTAPGTYTWTFGSGRARIDLDEEAGNSFYCEAAMEPLDGGFRLTYDGGICGGEVDDIGWTLEEDGLHLIVIETNAPLDQQKAYLETKP